jgi:hypothetical protein
MFPSRPFCCVSHAAQLELDHKELLTSVARVFSPGIAYYAVSRSPRPDRDGPSSVASTLGLAGGIRGVPPPRYFPRPLGSSA